MTGPRSSRSSCTANCPPEHLSVWSLPSSRRGVKASRRDLISFNMTLVIQNGAFFVDSIMRSLRFLRSLCATCLCGALFASAVCAQDQILYGMSLDGKLLDLSKVITGEQIAPKQVRVQLPYATSGYGAYVSLVYKNGYFYAGNQYEPPTGSAYAKLVQFGFHASDETYYTLNQYWPTALGQDANGTVFVAYGSSYGANPTSNNIGYFSSFPSSTITSWFTASDSAIQVIDGLLPSANSVRGVSFTVAGPNNALGVWFDVNRNNLAVSPYCSGALCWYKSATGPAAMAVDPVSGDTIVAQNEGDSNCYGPFLSNTAAKLYRLTLSDPPSSGGVTLTYLGTSCGSNLGGLAAGPKQTSHDTFVERNHELYLGD